MGVGLHLASLSSVSSPWPWPSHGPQKQRCRPKAVPSNPTCPGVFAETSFAFLLHFCLYVHIYASAESMRHRSGQVYRTRPLVKSHLCVALFAMHLPCRSAVQSSILAGKRVCTGSPFQFSL